MFHTRSCVTGELLNSGRDGNGDGVGAIDHHALEVEEEVGLVLDDRAAKVGAVGLELRVRLLQPVLFTKKSLLVMLGVLPETAGDAVKGVGARTC